MAILKPLVSLLIMSLSFSLIGCSTNSESSSTRALFDTRKEAENAAKDFNCKGAHKMDDKWMPCDSHKEHQENKKGNSHGHHHHNH
tara:strand:- start:251 stop:508 length:258 start_codon:yes stop_codon:yes gene_type:complete